MAIESQRDDGPHRLLNLRQRLAKDGRQEEGQGETADRADQSEHGAEESGTRPGNDTEREQYEHEDVEDVHGPPSLAAQRSGTFRRVRKASRLAAAMTRTAEPTIMEVSGSGPGSSG